MPKPEKQESYIQFVAYMTTRLQAISLNGHPMDLALLTDLRNKMREFENNNITLVHTNGKEKR